MPLMRVAIVTWLCHMGMTQFVFTEAPLSYLLAERQRYSGGKGTSPASVVLASILLLGNIVLAPLSLRYIL